MLQNPYKCLDVASKLVNIYPSHGYAIFREEMKRLGLIVNNLEDCPDETQLMDRYSKLKDGIFFIEDIYA